MAMCANQRLSPVMDRLHLQIDQMEVTDEELPLNAFIQSLERATDLCR